MKKAPSLLPVIDWDVREYDLESLVCDDDDCRGRRIRGGLGWIVEVCVRHCTTRENFGRCLGLSEDELREITSAVSEAKAQVRLMIYQWSSKDKLRGEATVRSFLEVLHSGGERELLKSICQSKQNTHTIIKSHKCTLHANVGKKWGWGLFGFHASDNGYRPTNATCMGMYWRDSAVILLCMSNILFVLYIMMCDMYRV